MPSHRLATAPGETVTWNACAANLQPRIVANLPDIGQVEIFFSQLLQAAEGGVFSKVAIVPTLALNTQFLCPVFVIVLEVDMHIRIMLDMFAANNPGCGESDRMAGLADYRGHRGLAADVVKGWAPNAD